MDYSSFKEHCTQLDLCTDLLSANAGFRQQLLLTVSLEQFSEQLCSFLMNNGCDINPDVINTWMDLALKFEKPLSAYKPRIDLKLDEIRWPLKAAVLMLFLIENFAGKIRNRPFGGWHNWLVHSLSSSNRNASHPPPVIVNRQFSPTAVGMTEKFNRLGNELWRQHIDWEDQELGPDVYDTGTHGGDIEPGYIQSALEAHKVAASMLGIPMGIEEYEYLFIAGRQHVQRNIKYDTTPRNLWRLRCILDDDVHTDIDPSHIRYIPHTNWEAIAFNYFYKKNAGSFRHKNPHVADYFLDKYGDNLTMTRKMIDREFMRCQICFFNEHHVDEHIRQAISKRLVSFYREMDKLGYDLGSGHAGRGQQEAGLQQIADLTRWLEILHPFQGGNTRHNIILLNKLLVESGFFPTILANRNDAPYRSVRGWKDQIVTGMLRWRIISSLLHVDLYAHLLQIRPPHFIYHQR